jgi:ThiF family protein
MSSERRHHRPRHLHPVTDRPSLRLVVQDAAGGDPATAPTDPPAPVLNPAVRVLWRGRDAVQLELGARAVVVAGVDSAAVSALEGRPGARAGRDDVAPELPTPAGAPPRPSLGQATTTLLEAGFLWPGDDAPGGEHPTDPRLRPPEPRLAGELAALTPRHGARSAEVLRARRGFAVAVHGTGRAAAPIAAVLASAGIGRLHVVDSEPVTLRHTLPGGLLPGDEGRPFAAGVADAVRRIAPETDLTPLPIGHRPDLVIVACDEPVDAERRESLHARRCTHLTVRLNDDTGAVGPMVLPGLTSCLRCADLHRHERDPAWGALAAQLSLPRHYGPASDTALATTIAGVAAREALAYLDGELPATVGATLEIQLPDWRIRRRSWAAHERCDCGAASAT